MKHLLLRGLMLLSAFMLFIDAGAQTKEKLVSLSVKEKSVEEILKLIEKQIPYKFMYHTADIKDLGKKSIELKDVAAKVAIEACLKGTKISYQFVEDIIVLKRIADSKPSSTKKRAIVGVVQDEKGEPLVGAFVNLAGTDVARIADAEGRFAITVPDEEQTALIVTFVGYDKKLVMVSENKPITVAMQPSAMAVEDVVVTGYQNMRQRDNVGSVVMLKADDIMRDGVTSISQMLQGQVAGMIVTNTSAKAGASPKIQIRGQSTLSSELGNQNPIWVVDGIIQDEPIQLNTSNGAVDDLKNLLGDQISWLNPNDIDKITILKDASATAIYGSRASNGVIVVTTKTPTSDRISVNYSGTVTVKGKPSYDDFNFMNSQERILITDQMLSMGMRYNNEPIKDFNTYDGLMQLYADSDISSDVFLKRRAELETMNTDWFDVLTRTAVSQNHNISVMGRASNKLDFSASMGYTKDNGQDLSNSNERFTSRIKVTANLHEKFKINFTVNGTLSKTEDMSSGSGAGSPSTYATRTSRSIPAYEKDGQMAYYKRRSTYDYNNTNPLSFNMENEINERPALNKGGRLSFGLIGMWNITKWLKYEFNGGYNYSDAKREAFYSDRSFYIANEYRGYDYGTVQPNSAFFNAAQLPFGGVLYDNNGRQYSYNVQNKLMVEHAFNEKHRFNFMIANEIRSDLQQNNSSVHIGLLPERGNQIIAPPSKITPITGNYNGGFGILDGIYGGRSGVYENKNNFFSLFATLVYSFNNRYVLNASVRNDMSNRFGLDTNNRFDPTYSFGLKWIVTDEPFLADRMKWLTSLNFSATYGIQGNAQLAMSPDLVFLKGTPQPPYNEFASTIKTIPNPNLTWERTKNWNFSVNGRLFNAVNFSVDYYWRKSNSVIQQNIGYENGISQMSLNGGIIYNKGVEASVSFNPVATKDFGFNVSFNTSKNWNTGGKSTLEIKNQMSEGDFLTSKTDKIVKEGYPIGAFWSYSFARLNDATGMPMFNYMDVNPEAAKSDPTLFLGYSGTSTPSISGGMNLTFRYKKRTLSSMFSMVLGGKTRLPNPYTTASFLNNVPDGTINLSKDLNKRWMKPGDENNTIYPALQAGQNQVTMPNGNSDEAVKFWGNSDAMVVNKDFLRCTNLKLSYNMTNLVAKKLKLNTLTIAGSVSNLFVVGSNRFNGFDPELGDSMMPRTFSLSLNIGF